MSIFVRNSPKCVEKFYVINPFETLELDFPISIDKIFNIANTGQYSLYLDYIGYYSIIKDEGSSHYRSQLKSKEIHFNVFD